MAKRVNKSAPESGIVKVVDPLYDAPVVVEAQPESEPVPPTPSFGKRVRRFFEFLLRLLALLIILGIIGMGLYYGLPLLYQKYIVPVEQNTAGMTELQAHQAQTEQDLADLQTRLKAMEAAQSQNAESLTELDQRVGGIETEIAAHTQSLAALERIQSELQEEDKTASAEMKRQVNLLKAMELMSRARLFMYQSNFGLAEQDVQVARDLLASVQRSAPESLADDLAAVVLHLDLTLSNLPNFPVAASDDLDIAWQILLLGMPPTQTSANRTPQPAATLSATPELTFTPTPQVTVEPTATQ